jgi:2-keto-3-deoxy-L-rhamnonate aldolase RhmA
MEGAVENAAPSGVDSLRARWRRAEPQVGIFSRMTTPESYELLAVAGLDFLVFDIEHGSFDRASLARCIFAARAGRIPVLARMADGDLPAVQHAIGAGADGIIVPHIRSAREIDAVASFARGAAIERAHAGATRAARFRETPWDAFRSQSERLLVIAQIDEPDGVAAAEAIAATQGVDGAFIGRIGLSVAMGGLGAEVDAALGHVCAAFRQRGLLIGMSLPDQSQAQAWLKQGVSLFVVDSDQRILLNSTRTRADDFRAALQSGRA